MASRHKVLWVGPQAADDIVDACHKRDLALVSPAVAQLGAEWQGSRGVVFRVSSSTDPLLLDVYEGLSKTALRHGLRVFVITPLAEVPAVTAALQPLPFARRIRVLSEEAIHKLPEMFARWEAGPTHSGAVEFHGVDQCDEEEIVLLRRAFSDSSTVTFSQLSGGRSAKVFQAFARLRNSNVGPHPLPFFVKLDRYPKIQKELENYRDCTALFIPFFARPNLDADRCILGAERGLIVGNFVEHSDSLTELVNRGLAQSAINSLFEDALRGWRNQAYSSGADVRTAPLAHSMGGALSSFSVRACDRAERYAMEAKEYGATLTAAEIAKALDNLGAIRHRCALSHGDLHGGNVRVRAGHAILIDFAAVEVRPLAADPAALETDLALRINLPPKQWRELVTELYSIENLRTLPPPSEPTGSSPELWNSIRQIRRFGLAEQLATNEYCTAVAVCLLRHGVRARDAGEDTIRRPILIWLAERLTRELQK